MTFSVYIVCGCPNTQIFGAANGLRMWMASFGALCGLQKYLWWIFTNTGRFREPINGTGHLIASFSSFGIDFGLTTDCDSRIFLRSWQRLRASVKSRTRWFWGGCFDLKMLQWWLFSYLFLSFYTSLQLNISLAPLLLITISCSTSVDTLYRL